jgi:hypothetical protein
VSRRRTSGTQSGDIQEGFPAFANASGA